MQIVRPLSAAPWNRGESTVDARCSRSGKEGALCCTSGCSRLIEGSAHARLGNAGDRSDRSGDARRDIELLRAGIENGVFSYRRSAWIAKVNRIVLRVGIGVE